MRIDMDKQSAANVLYRIKYDWFVMYTRTMICITSVSYVISMTIVY